MESPEAQWVAMVENRLHEVEKASDEKDREIALLKRELQSKVSRDELSLVPGTCLFSDGTVLVWNIFLKQIQSCTW